MCWLRVTFWVGEQATCQQDVMVQWPSIRNWPHDLAWMVEQRSQVGGSFGPESPELMLEVEQTCLEPAARFKPGEGYGYEVLIDVDTGLAAGECAAAGEGPAMRFYTALDEIRQFARDFKGQGPFRAFAGGAQRG